MTLTDLVCRALLLDHVGVVIAQLTQHLGCRHGRLIVVLDGLQFGNVGDAANRGPPILRTPGQIIDRAEDLAGLLV
jgi:hypothetical protein